jgi:hypothetical protein
VGQVGEFHPGPVPYELYNNGSLVQSGAFDFNQWVYYSLFQLSASGPCTLKTYYTNYFVAGQRGNAQTTVTFDNTATDPNPPYLNAFNIIANGEFTDTVFSSEGQINFSVADDIALDTVTLEYNGPGGWTSLPLTSGSSGSYSATVPATDTDMMIDLRLTASDKYGNTLNYQMNPAFQLKKLSSNADLSGLTISSGVLSPGFDSSITSYAATVNVPVLTITPTRADSNATVVITPYSPVSLSYGENSINIEVTAQDGVTKKNYALKVTRLSDNADLSDLTISQGALSPVFASGTLSYTDSVAYNVTGLTITPTAGESHSTITVKLNNEPEITVSSGSASPALNVLQGTNTIAVKVTAEDRTTTKTYIISATRFFNPSSSVYYHFINRNSGKYMHSFFNINNLPIVQYTKNTATYDDWRFVDAGEGYFKIKSRFSGKYIQPLNNSTADNTQIVQYSSIDNTGQQWKAEIDTTTGYYKIRNRASGYLLDILRASTGNSATCVQYHDTINASQQWTISN